MGNSGGKCRRNGNDDWADVDTERLEIRAPHRNDKPSMQQPPLLPIETLTRVHRVARFDGLSVVLIASIGAIFAAIGKDQTGAFIGLLVAGAGAMELHGASMLRAGY